MLTNSRFARSRCPSIVKAFIYMWHSDALDTFDTHFGTTSRFFDTKEAHWTTSITVSHWTFKQDLRPWFDDGRITTGPFPPKNIRSAVTQTDQKVYSLDHSFVIEETCSSVVITGDQHGCFWTCSVWSSLTSDESLSDDICKLPSMLQTFLHQQASRRNLTFVILLGSLCEKLFQHYDKVLYEIDQVVGLGVSRGLGY